jgi:branched-chain amino acid transport system substrate-binding protein
VLAAVAGLLSGCGTDTSRGGHVPGDTLAIYSSLPLQGPHGKQSRSIINGEKLALKEAGARAGKYKVSLIALDDSKGGDSRPGGWNPGKTADNASSAAEDSRTIAYIGEFDSGASANSIPITNEAGFAQISPAATAVGLTKLLPGADKGEPDKYYPTDERNFVRLVPADDVQALAAARWAKEMGVRRPAVIDDKTLWSEGLGEQLSLAFKRAGLGVVERNAIDPRASDYRDFSRSLAKKNPDLVYFTGAPENNALRLWLNLHDAMPRVRLMGSDKLLVSDFYARVGAAAPLTYITSVAEDRSQLPPEGRRFLRNYRREFGEEPNQYAPYGYTAMSLLLDAIRHAGDEANKRGAIVDELLGTGDFKSAIGTFSVEPSGDTTLDRIAGYRVRNGRLSFTKAIRVR